MLTVNKILIDNADSFANSSGIIATNKTSASKVYTSEALAKR